MTTSYLSRISLEPVRALAGFKQSRGSYYLERQILTPPKGMMEEIFPKADHWWKNYNSRQLQEDICAIRFLRMINFLRIVILQDAAFLMVIPKFHSL
jgi:Centromere DNA-binding protein complex CBF3 subunit, domain 2